MKVAKKLTDRLPDREKTRLVSCDMNANLHARVIEKMNKLKGSKVITWKSLIELAMEKWLEEV